MINSEFCLASREAGFSRALRSRACNGAQDSRNCSRNISSSRTNPSRLYRSSNVRPNGNERLEPSHVWFALFTTGQVRNASQPEASRIGRPSLDTGLNPEFAKNYYYSRR